TWAVPVSAHRRCSWAACAGGRWRLWRPGRRTRRSYFEWSADLHVDECPNGCTDHDDAGSDEAVLKANPAVGYRLTLDKVRNERLTLSAAGYARERLGVGEYPADEADTWQVIGEDAWRALAAAESEPSDPVAFAIDMTPERSHAAI